LHIEDTDPQRLVEGITTGDPGDAAFKLSEEAYNKRDDTLKKWKEQVTAKAIEATEIKVGDRCKVSPLT